MQKIVDIARAEVGTKESPTNSNKTKYGVWFGMDGVFWCAIFVSYCYFKAGFPLKGLGYTKGFAGCQYAHSIWKKSGEITKTPKAGDIVLFDWNKDGRFDHTEIFVRDLGDGIHFETIGGNTGPANFSNGGQVMVCKRPYSLAIFIHPAILDKAIA